MISLFKVASEVFLLALLVITFILHINLFVTSPEIMIEQEAPFSYAVNQILFAWLNLPNWLYVLICIGVLYSSAIYFGIVVAKHKFVSNYTYVPALLFVTVFALFNKYTYPSPVFLFLPLLILLLDKLFEISVNDKNLTRFLDVGLICGTLTLVYLPYWSLVIFVYVAFAILKPFYWRYWVATLIGFVCPALVSLIFFTLFNQQHIIFDYLTLQTSSSQALLPFFNLPILSKLVVLGAGLGIIHFFIDESIFKVTALMKQYRNLLNALIIFILLYQLIIQNWVFELNLMALIVIAIYYSNMILRVKQELFANVIHAVILVAVICFQIFVR